MKKRALLLALCLLLLAACARAEILSYVYGGSEDDILTDIAVAADGRILLTGYACSSDGTLSDRTKTGRSGWALCLDAQGNVLFSFLTRHGAHDTLNLPVFHEDGSCTALLQAEQGGGMEQELIRLDAQGALYFRKTLEKTDGGAGLAYPLRATDEGYLLLRRDGRETPAVPLYGYDGEYRYDADLASVLDVMARAERHVIRSERYGADAGGPAEAAEAFLCAVDEAGGETRLCKLLDAATDGDGTLYWPILPQSFVSLPDGGCAMAGYAADAVDPDEGRKGWIARFDAAGKRLFDWQFPDLGEIPAILPVEGGFAALAWERGANRIETRTLVLLFLDEDGVKRGETPLGEFWRGGEPKLAALPDGSLAALACETQPEDAEMRDAVLTIIEKEDIPR